MPDCSLLLLADILPTGVFAALQALKHPKLLPTTTGEPYPFCLLPEQSRGAANSLLQAEDRLLTFAIVGLGPVGIVSRHAMFTFGVQYNLSISVLLSA
jgi:hypothetical protein